jgi:hypothetical protein
VVTIDVVLRYHVHAAVVVSRGGGLFIEAVCVVVVVVVVVGKVNVEIGVGVDITVAVGRGIIRSGRGGVGGRASRIRGLVGWKRSRGGYIRL